MSSLPPSAPPTLTLLPTTTRAEALAALTEAMRGRLDAPEREARLVLIAAGGLRAIDLVAAPEAPLGAAAAALGDCAARRLAGEPLSRILGRREFWSLPLVIGPDTLDPRPETETIVEAALASLAARRNEPLRLCDFGVGSGAILCALLSELPAARGVGVDLSPGAAALTRANLAALGLAERADVRVGNWGDALAGPFDLIVANPPYIASADIAGLDREVRDYDPRLALDGGPDGLDAYRALAPQIARLLAADGRFFLEVGAGQAEAVVAILREAGLAELTTVADLAGIARVVAGRAAT